MNEKLKNVLENPANKLIAVDLDGTLCEGKFWEETCSPIQKRIDFIEKLYTQGAHVVIYTARDPKYFTITQSWLDTFGVKYHGISMGRKPGADIYIDDKAIGIDELDEFILK